MWRSACSARIRHRRLAITARFNMRFEFSGVLWFFPEEAVLLNLLIQSVGLNWRSVNPLFGWLIRIRVFVFLFVRASVETMHGAFRLSVFLVRVVFERSLCHWIIFETSLEALWDVGRSRDWIWGHMGNCAFEVIGFKERIVKLRFHSSRETFSKIFSVWDDFRSADKSISKIESSFVDYREKCFVKKTAHRQTDNRTAGETDGENDGQRDTRAQYSALLAYQLKPAFAAFQFSKVIRLGLES